MDVRSPLNQCIALALAGILFLNPIVAAAAELALDPASAGNTQLGQAGNGVPVVNIATPNGSGLSHNQFRDYNVGPQGLILNNVTDKTQATQLGGLIIGNPNLQGRAASTILNEVTGGNRSQLNGYTEVAGQSARVIVANPHGITCNGCGFINTPRATLTTGKPVVEGGQLQRFQVDGGDIALEGTGLNASNVDQFDLITRSAKLNAELHAQKLNIVVGRNDVQADNLAATPRADDGSARPALAIDSSALGGMYAGAIRLVGTEAGVGVKLAGNLAASGGDIQIDANGKLTLAQTAARGELRVNAHSAELTGPAYAGGSATLNTQGNLDNRQSLAARNGIRLSSGGQLSNQGVIEAGVNPDNSRNGSGDLQVTAKDLRNSGSLVASRNLDAKASQTLDNQGGTLSAQGNAQVSAGTLDNRQGRVLAKGELELNADHLDNRQAGLLTSAGALQANVGHLDNQGGEVSSQTIANLQANSVDNRAGKVIGEQRLQLTASASLDNDAGLLGSHGDLQLDAGTLHNRGGEIASGGAARIRATSLDNRQGGLVGSTKALTLDVGALDNRAGEVSSQEALQLSGEQLDNSDTGRLLAGTRLELAVAQVINRSQGLIAGKTTLDLNGTRLDNRGGRLLSQQAMHITLGEALSNQQGLIGSEGPLVISVDRLDNRAGSLSSAGALALVSRGTLDNDGGHVLTDGSLTLASASLSNRQGVLSAKGKTQLTTGRLDNSQGQLTSADALNLSAGELINNAGRIGSDRALTASAARLEQQGGQLFSNTDLSLDLQGGDLDNRQGLINAPGQLLLKNLGGVNNQGGELSSQRAFTLAARSLDNASGKLLSAQALTLRIDQALANLKGLIAGAQLDVRAASLANGGGTLTSRGDTRVEVAGLLVNDQQGLINAAQTLSLNAGALDNRSGSLLAGTALDLRAQSIDNRDNGLINSRGGLDLQASSLDSSAGGEVSAQGALGLVIDRLIQRQGRLIGAAGLSLDLNGGDLDNQGGLIVAQGPLSVSRLRDLANQRGEISSSQGFSLVLRNLDNTGGQLISSGQLDLTGAVLGNQGGLLSGWQGLSVSGQSLDNRNLGTLSSRDGNLSVNLGGALQNSGEGALASKGRLDVRVASLDNSGQGVVSSGGDQHLDVTTTLNNSAGGQIDSGAKLNLKAASLNNAAGTVQAQQALTLDSASLDNRAGSIAGNAALSLNLLGTFANANGKLASVGPLLLQGATQIDNQGGQIASQGPLTLLIGSLDNRNRGTVAANGALLLSASGAVQNDNDGLIYSRDADIAIQSASLDNNLGSIQAKGDLTIATGAFANLGGRTLSQAGSLAISASNLDNRGGTLASLQGWVKARLGGWLDNGIQAGNGGVIQGHSLDLTAASVSNQGGHLSALAGDALLSVASLDNRQGALFAKQRLQLTGGSLSNAGQIAAGRVDFSLAGALNNRSGIIESDTTLILAAASLDNQGGQLRALDSVGRSQLTVSGLLDNRSGTLEIANTDFGLATGRMLNSGGQLLHVGSGHFDVALASVANAGGSFVTRGDWTLSGDSWTNNAVIQADRLTLNVGQLQQTADGQLLASGVFTGTGGNWTNDGLIASDGVLNLSLGGTYSGSGRVTSLGDLGLSAAQLNLPTAGRITGGGATSVWVSGLLSNRGVMTSASGLTVNAGALQNYGTLGSAQQLRLVTPNLLNQNGLIFSGGDMALRVASLSNRYADIYSLGTLEIAADDVGTRSAVLENLSATLESQGDMSLKVAQLTNRKDVFVAGMERQSGRITITATDNCKGKHCWALYNVRETYQVAVTEDSASANLIAGGHLVFQGDSFINQYSLVAAGGDISVSANSFSNLGAAGGYERYRHYEIYTRSDAAYWGFVQNQGLYNRYNDPDSADYDPGRMSADSILIGVKQSESTLSTAGTVVAPAIIQAGGKIDIRATQDIDNGLVRPAAPWAPGSNRVQDTGTGANSLSTPASLNGQLPPDLAQQQVNPLVLPGFSLPSGSTGLFRLSDTQGSAAQVDQAAQGPQNWALGAASIGLAQREQVLVDAQGRPLPLDGEPQNVGAQSVARVQGLPANQGPPKPHKYLIETNPELTSLKQFLSSDYLLGQLGYDPDQAQKRLGDGLYEQRLVREAIAARTGQRFLDGLSSDEAIFRYLMDNAIASQQSLNLSVGVSLSAAQVAALTHDIVWLEAHEVNGEQVLVPVLYLAQADGRLAPNGALIQGKDVALISGGDLTNQGTLRASANLSASASNLVNGGLMEAGNRLDLLATDSIRNAQGGIIAGRDVSAIALTGDLLNERSVTTLQGGSPSHVYRDDVVNSAARIEAANSLSLSAGRDLANIGGTLSAGGNARLSAGRDLLIGAAEELDHREGRGKKSRWSDTTVTQHSSGVRVAGDLKVDAGRDLAVIASQVGAGGDIELAAGRDLGIASAANESHYESYSKHGGKKLHIQQEQVRQQGSAITAGGDLSLISGNDLTLTASQLKAGNAAYLYAGNDLSLLAAEDSDYSLYDKKKKGSFGSKKTQRDEVTDVRHVGSRITTGGDLTLVSEGDQRYQKARLESGADLTLASGGEIAFEAVKELHQESHEKSKGDLAWTSAKGKGTTDETVRQSALIAQGEIAIRAVEGLKVDLKHIDRQTVSQTIDAMVQADPNLAWIKQLEQRGDVDWRQVQEVHDSFKYSHSGLGAGAQLAIAVLVTYLTWGAASAAVGTAANATAGSGTAMAAAGTNAAGASVAAGWGNIAATSVITSVATKGATSAINNKGDLGAALKDTFDNDSLKGYIAAGVSGGIGGANLGLQIAVNSAVKTVLQGGKFKDNLTQAAIDLAANALSGAIYQTVGDSLVGTGLPTKVAVHAIVGGLIAEAAGGDFRTGALAAGANEALIDTFGKDLFPGEAHDRVLAMTSQLIGITVAAAAGGDEKAQEKAGWVAQQATVNNYLKHEEVEQMLSERAACADEGCRLDVQERWAKLDEQRNRELDSLCQRDLKKCVQLSNELLADAPKIQALAEQVKSSGDAGAAAAIGWIIPESNQTAQNIITNNVVVGRDGASAGFWANAAQLIAGMVGAGKPASGAKGSSTISTGAENAANAAKLRTRLAAEEIAGGHAFEKHVLIQGEFKGLGIRTREQFASHIENVMTNPSSVRYYKDGRTVYLQESTGTVVFRNPNGGEGTAFQPKNWKEYTSTLPTKTAPY
ncbi:two-partner secretion domain-containing protein [Pseudomonas sp. Q1-7]|uniref:two-partner secretion domain-containing protein n=1 Tax=Pseudomonas sp. Q1-7 TaxID=3020843 RepID=UPI0023018D4A|nr:filamentous hemagglutinin N-terminal domain-containing protein [Pseudomonas sp. Q1-7]